MEDIAVDGPSTDDFSPWIECDDLAERSQSETSLTHKNNLKNSGSKHASMQYKQQQQQGIANLTKRRKKKKELAGNGNNHDPQQRQWSAKAKEKVNVKKLKGYLERPRTADHVKLSSSLAIKTTPTFNITKHTFSACDLLMFDNGKQKSAASIPPLHHPKTRLENNRDDKDNLIETKEEEAVERVPLERPQTSPANFSTLVNDQLLEQHRRRTILVEENESIQKENAKLKEENAQLRQAVLEGMRGSGRFVGGGQFRTLLKINQTQHQQQLQQQQQGQIFFNEESDPFTLVERPHTSCGRVSSKEESEEETLKSRKREKLLNLAYLQAANDELKKTCESLRVKINELNDEVSGKREEAQLLRLQLLNQSSMEKELSDLRQKLERGDKMINALHDRISKDREKYGVLNREMIHKTKEINILKEKLRENELTNSQKNQGDAMMIGKLTKKLEDAKAAEKREKDRAEALTRQSHAIKRREQEQVPELECKNRTIEELEAKLRLKEADVNILRKEKLKLERIVQEDKDLQGITTDLRNRLTETESKLDEARTRRTCLEKELCQQTADNVLLQEEIMDLRFRFESSCKELASVKDAEANLRERNGKLAESLEHTTNAKNNIARQLDTSYNTILNMTRDVTSLRDELRATANLFMNTEKAFGEDEGEKGEGSSNKNLPVKLKAHLTKLKDAHNKLAREFEELQQKDEENQARIAHDEQQLQRLEKVAIESTIKSLLRLSVVAPVVQLNINTHSNRRTAKRLEQQQQQGGRLECKGNLPLEKLRKTIEQEVLPRFTEIFVKKTNDKGPDGKTTMDEWLSKLVEKIQRTVESNVKNIFNND